MGIAKMKIKTQAAQAAAAIKAELKIAGFKAKVKSSNFSGGNSVNVYVPDMNPAQIQAINEICDKYQYGQFNGMEDYYEYTNRRDDLPQAKYVSVNNEISDELYQKAWDWCKGYFSGMDDAPEAFFESCKWRNEHNEYGSTMAHRVIGCEGDFWKYDGDIEAFQAAMEKIGERINEIRKYLSAETHVYCDCNSNTWKVYTAKTSDYRADILDEGQEALILAGIINAKSSELAVLAENERA